MASDNPARSASKRFSDLPDADPACEGCGYNLRGQPLDGRCPECGLDVARSASQVADRASAIIAATGVTDERRASDLRWGPWLILGAGAIVVTINIVPPNSYWGTVRMAMLLAAWILAAAGVLVSTRPASGLREGLLLSLLRAVARACAVIAVLALLCNSLRGHPSLIFAWDILRICGVSLSVCAAIAGTIAYFTYAFRVAWFADNRAAAWSSITTIVLLIGGIGLLLTEVSASQMKLPALLDSKLLPLPIIGFGWVGEFWPAHRFTFGMVPTLQLEFAIRLLTGVQWCAAITLVQLALMPGRVVAKAV